MRFHSWCPPEAAFAARRRCNSPAASPALDDSGDEGVWLTIPIAAGDSAAGALRITAKALQGNVVLSRFAVAR